MCFACQAKKLYPNGAYKKIFYNKYGEQTLKLMDYAKKHGYFPAFLLYNFEETPKNIKEDDITQYGCSIIAAEYIHDEYIVPKLFDKLPNFNSLHPPACKLTFLASSYKDSFKENFARDLGCLEDWHNKIVFINKMDIDNGNWQDITSESDDSYRNAPFKKGVISSDEEDVSFSPKYRIAITL